MKYKDTTQEQRESITPYLRQLFETNQRFLSSYDVLAIYSYQQAQKAEIERLQVILWGLIPDTKLTIINDSKTSHLSVNAKEYIREQIDKLKFESELQ